MFKKTIKRFDTWYKNSQIKRRKLFLTNKGSKYIINSIDAELFDISNPQLLSEVYNDFKNHRQNSGLSIISEANIRRDRRTNRIRDISSIILKYISFTVPIL